jgi:hypothetical protein
MRRTSVKAFIAAAALLAFGILGLDAAEAYDLASNRIRFGLHHGRPWNLWDFVWITSFTLSASLAIVGLMFLNRNE